jgi:putative peptidoglycan lipid II flippase
MSDYQEISSDLGEKHKFTRRLGAFSSATLISRVLGYVRDAMVAAMFGGGLVTDAFYAAFKVPNLLRRFLGEGSLTAAFVPVFTDVENKKGREEANYFLNSLMLGLIIIILMLVSLGIIFAPTVARLVAWGFTRDPAKFQLTVDLVRLMCPFLLVVSLAALMTAVLNASGRFFIPALAPSGLSIGEIGFMVLLASSMESPVHGLAISAVVGGGIHFIWQLPSLYREGYFLKLVKPFAHPKVKTVFLLMIPTVLGLAADQINSFVDQFCASFLRDGSITALYNSNRVMQLPLALFGIAVASVALPALSKSASNKNETQFKDILNFSLRIANFVLIPAFIGLIVMGLPIIQALFQRGLFTEEYSRLTFTALAPYALGLPAYSAVRIMANAFYARQNTRTPAKIALWAMGLHVILNVILMQKFQVAGLAFSTAISAWFQAFYLFIVLRKDIGNIGGWKIFTSFLYGSLVGLMMGGGCWYLINHIMNGMSVYLQVLAGISVGVLFYFLISKILRIQEYEFFVNSLLKRKISNK